MAITTSTIAIFVIALFVLGCTSGHPVDRISEEQPRADSFSVPGSFLISVNDEDMDTLATNDAWYGFDVINGKVAAYSPLQSTPFNTYPFAETEENLSLFTSSSSVFKAEKAAARVSGSYAGFSAAASTEMSHVQDETSSTIHMYFNEYTLTHGRHLVTNTMTFKDGMKEEFDEDPVSFYDKYGTHLIVEVYYGCSMKLTTNYEFSSVDEKSHVAASLEAKYHGVASAEAVAEVVYDINTHSQSSTLEFEAHTLGYIIDPEVEIDHSDASTYIRTFKKAAQCNNEHARVRKIRVMSFSYLLHNYGNDVNELNVNELNVIKQSTDLIDMTNRLILTPALDYYTGAPWSLTSTSPNMTSRYLPEESSTLLVCKAVEMRPLGGYLIDELHSLLNKARNGKWGNADMVNVTKDDVVQYRENAQSLYNEALAVVAGAVTKVSIDTVWRDRRGKKYNLVAADGQAKYDFHLYDTEEYEGLAPTYEGLAPTGLCCHYHDRHKKGGSCKRMSFVSCPNRVNYVYFYPTLGQIFGVIAFNKDSTERFASEYNIDEQNFMSAGENFEAGCDGTDNTHWCDGMFYAVEPSDETESRFILGCPGPNTNNEIDAVL
eukprot:Nk52_evm1s972 gene=Nk52_evmTU1s972